METDIALVAALSMLAHIALFGAIGWGFYRVLRSKPVGARIESQSHYAHERAYGIRHPR